MNTSGGPVSALVKYYSLPVDRVLIVHDELDIPFDTVRLKQGGGHGGHNGVRDVTKALDGGGFTRVRVGIGRPPGRQDSADFVLKEFSGAERQAVPNLVSDAADAVEAIVEHGLVAAQQRFHSPA
jgi:PTH1 family peptidyl-tRNA hydrolase